MVRWNSTSSNSGTSGSSSNQRYRRNGISSTYRNKNYNDNDNNVKKLVVLRVENLDYEILEKDLLDVFERVGPISNCRIDYDKAGRSNGSAEITFRNLSDVQNAYDRFNEVPLDGRNLKCSVITKNVPIRSSSSLSRDHRNYHRNLRNERKESRPFNQPWKHEPELFDDDKGEDAAVEKNRLGKRYDRNGGRKRGGVGLPTLEDLDVEMEDYFSSSKGKE